MIVDLDDAGIAFVPDSERETVLGILFLGMFLVWCIDREATWDGRAFHYVLTLDIPIRHISITGTIRA